jgi:hypothetical protein
MFNSNDGSVWKVMNASRLSAIEIWKGNRLCDETHVEKLSQSIDGQIKNVNLNPFRVVLIHDETGPVRYIIDGQHRAKLLKKYFTNPESEDFEVVVIEKECSNESEIIQLFKIINTTRSIQWKEDPVLVANKYIDVLLKEFNIDPKKPVIKSGKTVKPFLSVDKLRDVLISKHIVDWKLTPSEFLENSKGWNENYLLKLEPTKPMFKKALELKFALGVNEFEWV